MIEAGVQTDVGVLRLGGATSCQNAVLITCILEATSVFHSTACLGKACRISVPFSHCWLGPNRKSEIRKRNPKQIQRNQNLNDANGGGHALNRLPAVNIPYLLSSYQNMSCAFGFRVFGFSPVPQLSRTRVAVQLNLAPPETPHDVSGLSKPCRSS